MSALALTAALYGVAAAQKWSFSVFLALQGMLPSRALAVIVSTQGIPITSGEQQRATHCAAWNQDRYPGTDCCPCVTEGRVF